MRANPWSTVETARIAVTTGLPWLVDEPEPVDAVAVATKVVEAIGLGFALQLILTTTRKEARP